MAEPTFPLIDQSPCATWRQQDVDKYLKLPFWLAQVEANMRRDWMTWPSFFKKRPWKSNNGYMRVVMTETSPLLRQVTYPQLLRNQARLDLASFEEREAAALLFRQKFASPHYSFVEAFEDFIADKFKPASKSILRTQNHFEECFYRTWMLQKSPYMYIAGHGLIEAPHVIEGPNAYPDGTNGKTDAWFEATAIPACTSKLTLAELYRAEAEFSSSVGATPFAGSEVPKGTSQALDEKYCLITDSIQWSDFIEDPWLKENRPVNMNIITEKFRGDFWGRVVTKFENLGMRLKYDADGAPNSRVTWPEPEEKVTDNTNVLYGRTRRTADYVSGYTHMISWLIGGESYQIINVGPPPAAFASAKDEVLSKMNWNGKIYQTDRFTVPCYDDDGDLVGMEDNSWGEFRRLQSQLALGILATHPQNVLPILHKKPDRALNVISA